MNYKHFGKFCPGTSGELTGFRWFHLSPPSLMFNSLRN